MNKPFSCIKLTLLILNTIFLAFAIVLVAIGAFSLNNLNEISSLISTGLPIAAIVIGVFVFIVSFFGCCGAAIEHAFFLLVYVFIILGLMICQLAIGGAAYYEADNVYVRMESTWKSLDPETKTQYEQLFECCGWAQGECPSSTLPPCGVIIPEFIQRNLRILAAVVIIFGCLEVIGLFFALCLYCCIQYKQSSKKQERLL
eukprot:TRINITY_DN8938_c0_g1_i1.p1 TRINITY_DN8938_c0_g1~~TRINITY_DN8938_c0_g1_i1.p1  ORF type:complete len:201 (+),score=76.02 TRINITY_DN8938_c0_g1_i1:148-750(+)